MALSVDIRKSFRGFTLNMQFETGDETLALLGASGCGKSMTLRCVAGIEKPDEGRIVLDGVTLFDSRRRINLRPQDRRIGLMLQRYSLFPQMTVAQNIRCGARSSLRGADLEHAVDQALATYGIADLRDRLPHQLSGGQQQRVALARMLVSRPGILMLDEPFSALDSHLRFRMEQEVREVIRRFGGTVLLVSHSRDEVFRMADRVAIMKDGRIDRIGTRKEVFSDPGTREACMLTGCKNVSRVRRISDHAVEATDWGIRLNMPIRPDTDALGIRMHHIRPGKGRHTFRCAVTEVIENPFSVTVMLRPLDAPADSVPIGWETEPQAWAAMRAKEVTVHFPEHRILQLRG